MDANYFSNEPYAENPIEVVAPTDTTGSSAYAYHYTLDGSVPDESDPLFTSNITLNYGDTLKIKRYGIGSGNNKYHPSPIMVIPNYTPEIVLEECCNLYDQLVWEGNTDKINTFWNNKPLDIQFFIKKIHNTYFLYIDPFAGWNRYYGTSTSGDTSYTYSSLDCLYCKALIFYSKDLKTWHPIPGFENNFNDSSVSLRGKLSNKYILDIYYYNNNYHILYLNIDPEKIENFITATITDTASSTFGNKNYQRIPRYNRSLTMSYQDFEDTGGLNSTEEVNLYEVAGDEIENINILESNVIYLNLENVTDFSINTGTWEQPPFYLDSRFVLQYARASHFITNNRIILNIGWPSLTNGTTTSNFAIREPKVLLEKLSNEESFNVRTIEVGYDTGTSPSSGSGTHRYESFNVYPLIMPSLYKSGYCMIPYGNEPTSTSIHSFYIRNFNIQNILNETSSIFQSITSNTSQSLTDYFFNKENDLFYNNNLVPDINSTSLGRWDDISGVGYNNINQLTINYKQNYLFGRGCYISEGSFYLYMNKYTSKGSYIPSELDKIVCSCLNFSSIPETFYTYLPKNYTFLVHDTFDENGTNAMFQSVYCIGNLDDDNFGYLSLFNSEGEPILFKIHLENPAKQTEENQISTMSLDDKKIYRLQTRRINIEENKESTTNETQPLTTEQ